jgi:hypothetical protein
MRRAEYMAGRDATARADMLRAARVVEWELARRWPEQGRPGPRTDDRPELSPARDNLAWQRVYAVGRQALDWIRSLNDPDLLTQAKVIEGPRHGAPPINHGSAIEWYTPPKYVEAARAVLGSIGTDPATSETAQLTVRAATYYTAETDGLANPWHGPVWCNPPYSSKLIRAFTERLVAYPLWVCLTNNGTDTDWGQALLRTADAVCFPDHRLRFLNADNEVQGSAMQGQMFTYRGPRPDRFAGEFAKFGAVLL